MKKNEKLNEYLSNTESDEIWVCAECGNPDIEERRWVNLNSAELCGGTDDGEFFCNGCKSIIYDVMFMKEYNDETI